MEPYQNGDESTSPLQRIAIGAGALIVVVLTVVAAVFLTMQDLPQETPTAVAQLTPTATSSPTTAVSLPPTSTSTPLPPPPPDTPTVPAPSDTPTSVETGPTPIPPAATDTPMPGTATFTPLPPPPTATSTSSIVTNCGQPPPAGWVAYTTQLGDTLNTLAKRTDSSVFDLQNANCLNEFDVGDVVYLPTVPTPPTATRAATPVPQQGPTATRTSTPFAPRISNVIAGKTDTDIFVVVEGENFRSREAGFRAELRGPTTIVLTLGQARSDTSFEASAPIPGDLPPVLAPGAYDLVVINPNGRLDTRTDVFPPSDVPATATPLPPEVTRVSPTSGNITGDVLVTIQGRNFRPLEAGFRVEIRSTDGTISVVLSVDQTVRPATGTSFDVIIRSGELAAGSYDLLVTNPDGQTDIERTAFNALP